MVSAKRGRRLWLAVLALLLLLFVLRPGASRLKARIASSIAAALGRPVEIGSVHLRLLPQPGFELEDLIVYDDSSFGSEPLLRAPEVTAALRLTSMLRGRIEIARLDLTEPSLNLVHEVGGRWNLEVLLERAARSPLAPTAKAKSEARPAFPYIEATSGRINVKFGQEKKPYALINADFSLWQDTENTWGARVKGQPFRSDLSLSDTGLVQINGSWQRAENLRQTPLRFSVEWDRAQLGQFTKFLTGADKGWRGAVLVSATLVGTPEKLRVASDGWIRDFRRYDILTGEPVTLAGHCDGFYSSIDRVFREVLCRAPVGAGAITLHGELGLPGSHNYDLVVTTGDLPASALAQLGLRVKKNLPEDLVAEGKVQASFSFSKDAGNPSQARVEGRGKITDLRLVSSMSKTEFSTPSLPFALAGEVQDNRHPEAQLSGSSRLQLGPVTLGTGKLSLSAKGWINRDFYDFSLAGPTDLARALHLAHLFGIPALNTSAEGMAELDLRVAGTWNGWSADNALSYGPPQVTGSARLKNVRVPIRGTNGPIEISTADIELSDAKVKVSRLKFMAAHAAWTGSLEMPRGCGTPSTCSVQFRLNTNQTSLSELRQWAQSDRGGPWYTVLTTSTKNPPSYLGSLRAVGQITVDHLRVQHLEAANVSGNVNLDQGSVTVSDLRGDLLGGTQRGEWKADFTHKPPVYSGSGTYSGISMADFADSMHDPWISGTANGSYRMTASGISSSEFWRSAEVDADFSLSDGALPHVSLAGDGIGLKVNRFEGRTTSRNGIIEIRDATLDSSCGNFQVTGTASLNREIDFQLKTTSMANSQGSARGYTITGTLAEPLATALLVRETQAQLKP
ncbi:MAG TPA: AsmA family protein [Candidatus Sulfotelmatobacter sp.]